MIELFENRERHFTQRSRAARLAAAASASSAVRDVHLKLAERFEHEARLLPHLRNERLDTRRLI
jgi:hypothetical protein